MTKTLTREEILRLQKKQAGTVGGSGSSSGGGITQAQLDAALARKVDVDFFAQLFEVYDGFDPATATKIETNATMPTSTTSVNIKALFGFWSQGFISALGVSPGGGGGGGGASYLGDLEDVTLSSPSTGQALVYRNGKWINETISAGVTSINTGTGLSGGPITGAGTISIDSTYQTYISHGESAYNWGNHASAGYLKTSTFEATTWWGRSPSNGAVSGSLSNVGNISMNGNINNTNNNQMDITVGSSGLRITSGAVTLINPTAGIRIGDALLSWDGQKQCLKISNAANTSNPMSVYATGGVSTLGMSST
jgi:hypothetical protein